MANLDIYELIDVQNNNGQECLNVYFYRRDSIVGTGTDADALLTNWATNVLPLVQAVQNTSVLHTALRVRNLFDEEDVSTLGIAEAGTVTNADEAPIFNAVNVKLDTNNGAVRPGSKRYTGLDESWISNGVLAGTPAITNYTNLVDELITPMLEGALASWFPVVVKRILEGSAYRLPTTPEEAIFGGIISAVYNTLITSQTSRKIGVGS
jgi:hypothetical protein